MQAPAWKHVTITIPSAQVAEMIAHALETDPEECCGILFGRGTVVTRSRRVRNVHESRARRYTMAPLELINAEREADRRGEEFVAFYHSHPSSQPYPSERDVKQAFHDVVHVIVSLMGTGVGGYEKFGVLRAFRISEGAVTEVPVRIQ